MRKFNNQQKHKRNGRLATRLVTWVMLFALLVQTLSLGCFAVVDDHTGLVGGSSATSDPVINNGIGKFDSDETIARLKKDFLKSLNQDLLQKVEDYELRGEVNVILSFSDNSLISSYTESGSKGTYETYRKSALAEQLMERLADNQNKVLAKLEEKGLISEVKYQYYHALDGAYVKTTYEQIEEICNVEGIERVIISNTYEPAEAVENPVNVYDTGIFNSGDVSYTGRGTIVAVLDTGCDYTHSAFTSYQVQSPLYDRDSIEAKLADTMAYQYSGSLEAREVYYGNITGGKIAFGYDYADRDADVMPFSNEHGTHVAGVIAGKDDTITGVAVDAQLAIMKVFSDYDIGAEDGDILAALEDAVVLGVDAINMSLGSSSGFSREVDDEYKNTIYDRIQDAGISLIVAASNDYSSAFGSEHGNTNKTSNPDSATVGSPSTYDAAMSVASINGNKDKYMLANGNREVFFTEAFNQGSKEYDFFAMLGVTAGSPKKMEYVSIPGVGMAINYTDLDMAGKIALVRRGDITFEEKVQYAYEAGAAGVIIYNNVFGDISMTVGNDLKIPVVSIGKDDGEALAAQETGTLEFDITNQAGPFMSDFSSWGPNPDLTLKPEITAHGGNILSAVPGGGYEKLSGTSMAAPNMCGIVVLIRQYVKENYEDSLGLSVQEVRDLVNQLCMSTATIALDRKGNPYSPRKQGAGIADIAKATTTQAYLLVDGIGKTKLELGDDPTRSGVYTMSIQLKNLSNAAVSYRVGSIAMTESMSTSDPEYVAEMGYLLSNTAEYSVQGGTLTDGIVTVEGGGCATVTVTLTLSAADKSYLNANFQNGMYVEGYLTFENVDENGVDLNAPFLAFYGDWSEAPIFDLDYYEVETEAHNNAIDDDDKIKADYYATTPAGTYYYDYILPLGSYVYQMDESAYTPIPATEEKAAISYYAESISGIYGVFTGLLRGAKEMNISIKNTTTGEIVWTDTKYNCYKAHYNNGSPYPYVADIDLPMANYETGDVFGYNNMRFEVTMTAKLDWDGNRNSSDTYTFSFYIDYEAPTITDATFRTEYDKSEEKNRYYVDVMVYDNQYAMSLRPIIVYDYAAAEEGGPSKTYASLTEYPIPIYQENRGEVTKVTVEITDYLDLIKGSGMPEGITFYIDDYAMNSSICYVPFPESENAELEFLTSEMDLDINETFDLTTYLVRSDNEALESAYLQNLTWTCSDESVVAIKDGRIEALKAGTATVSVTASTWKNTEAVGDEETEVPLYKTVVIHVSDTVMDNPNSAGMVQIEGLKFTSYKTLFAFTSDIDYSEIGETDSINYFDGDPSISFYPSEKLQLFYDLEPWNIDPERYELKWTSSNPKVVTVDENGVVKAEAEGKARITLQITIDGKTSLLAARCSVEVKSEFVIENRSLIAYKGKGGDVVIPDDEGIMTIGAFAFCHYDLDNAKEVEKDEHGNYDLDDKKAPLGNNTVTSVVIPQGVETISKYAFYNCEVLSSVTLPEGCKTIEEYAFYNCPVLENVNLDYVKVISDYAFAKCDSLNCKALGGINLSGVNAIGKYAFSETRIDRAILSNLSLSGEGAFMDCSKLTTVELGERTRLAPKMFENTPVESIVIYSDMIPDEAFKGCTKLTDVVFRGDLTYLGSEAFSGCTRLKNVTFDGVCEEIAGFAFYKCSALKEVTLPDCEVVIGDCAFAETGLTQLTFAKDTYLESFGIGVLDSASGLALSLKNSEHYKLVDGIVYSKDGTRLVLALPDARLGDFTVPASVKEICDGAFSSNRYLSSVSFAEGSALETIGYGAFGNCIQLKRVTLPKNNAVTIGDMAFYECTALRQIDLEKVTHVGMFAFEGTALTSVSLPENDVVLGMGAFYGCSSLKEVTLGAGARIGDSAFLETSVVTVNLLGDGVTVDTSAFYACTRLTTLDFSKLNGVVGDYAFYGCTSLINVNMPHVTEIGEGCFADCTSLESFSAAQLEVIGDNAFAPSSEDMPHGAVFTSVSLPFLRVIGEGAFYGCVYLQEIDLSHVTEIGAMAFALCQSLTKVTFSDQLTELRDQTFYGCTMLQDIDLSHIVRFGQAVLYGVPLPARLELTAAEYVGSQAFVEMEDGNYLEFVNAPNLTYVADQAFAGCTKLTGVYAPKLEFIGYGAFAYTAIQELEVSDTLQEVEFSLFEGCEKFVAFYMMVNGEKVYDFVGESIMLKDGVLYTVVKNGYVLSVYPSAKTDKEYTLADGTVRIEYTAAMNNKNLEKVIFPESLRSIGNYAFFGCENLATVVFHSYYAPKLEGTVTGDELTITPETLEEYPGFDKLYKYDYYFIAADQVAMPLYYFNFVGAVTSKAAQNITYVIPDGCEGYDSPLYKAYFLDSDTNSGKTVGKYAVAFIDAVRLLPETVDRFDKKLINAAINAYNALEGHADEMAQVDDTLFERFRNACSAYNVSVTENKINHLFDMDCSEYSFELVKDARASWLALSEAEQAMVTNSDRLMQKIADLAAAMGVELDFSLSFADHFKSADPEPPVTDPPIVTPAEPVDVWMIVLIVSVSVVVVAAVAVTIVIVMKKRKVK